jgi:hypothetical protein
VNRYDLCAAGPQCRHVGAGLLPGIGAFAAVVVAIVQAQAQLGDMLRDTDVRKHRAECAAQFGGGTAADSFEATCPTPASSLIVP